MKEFTVNYFPYNPGHDPHQIRFAKCLEDEGFKVVRVPPTKFFPLNRAAFGNPDILHLDWPHDFYSGRNEVTQAIKTFMYYVGLKKLKDVKVVWTAHNLVAHNSRDIHREKKMIQKLIDVCDGIFLLSESSRSHLLNLYNIPDHATIRSGTVCHYVDVYENEISKKDAKKRFENLRKKVFVHIGRIQQYKGTLQLLRQFNKLNNYDASLIIAGTITGEDFRRQVWEEVTACNSRGLDVRLIEGFVDDGDLQVYFNAADFVVLPFEDILNSGSTLLALSFGKVIIAPDIGSLKEVIPTFGWIRYDPVGDNLLYALRAAIEFEVTPLLENQIIGYVKSAFNWSSNGRELTSLYSNVVGKEVKRVD